MDMLRLIFCLGILSLCLSSCGIKKETTTSSLPVVSEKKPDVALVPIIDHSRHRLNWNVSGEITAGIYEALKQKDHCRLAELHKIKKLAEAHDPFGADLSWIKQQFSDHDFVIFALLLEHSEKPSYPTEEVAISDSPTDLKITFQLRVFDLRGEEPKVILQETFEKTQHIPRQFSCFNFPQVAWGEPLYTFSPMGVIHAELIDEIALHVENYILLAGK
jgi:hypothetical protein